MSRGVVLFFLILCFSCSSKFSRYSGNYNFASTNGIPDYGDLDYWAAHPWKWDPSDSIPAPLRDQKTDSLADVFFLHPTTYTTGNMSNGQNAAVDDKIINAKTDYTTILYQASVFNQHCRVFAPRYSQAHISSFFMRDTATANRSFEIAYQDIKSAFEYYLQHWNRQRPIIIASHSQGSKHAERLLKEFFENKKLKEKLIVAYIIGWPVPDKYFSSLAMCSDSLKTGCLCSWRTFKKGFTPDYIKKETARALVTNPLTWKTGNDYASENLHRGSVLRDFNTIYTRTTGAKVKDGVLWVSKPDFRGSIFYLTRNYHIGDINLFYVNLRQNVEARIRAFLQRQ